jgi:hypothetical protein
LVAPFLPEGIVGEVDFQKKRLQRKIVVKSSGSGMPKQWIDSLINYSKNHQIPLEVWLPDKKIVVDKDDRDQWVKKEDETFRPENLEEYARLFYQSLVDTPPEFLISYPSEMVQVAAWMRGRGWKGNFFMLPASATHEEVNARWAEEFLQAETINFDNLDIESLKRSIDEEAIDKLRRQLGRLSIKEVITNLIRLGIFDNENHRWVNRYMPKEKSYWQTKAAEVIVKIKNGSLDYSKLIPEEQTRIIELVLHFSSLDDKEKNNLAIKMLWQIINKKVFLGENFDTQINTENDSYVKVEKLGPVARILLKDKDPRLAEAFVFGFGDLKQVFEADERLFGFLERYLPFIRSLYKNSKGEDYIRKVNEGLYLRHILRTMVLADEFYRQLTSKKISLNYDVLMMAAALHDAIEMSRKKGGKVSFEYLQQRLRGKGFNEDDARNISHMLEFLVPKETSSENYFEQKQKDFDRIWDGKGLDEEEKPWWEANKDYLKVIKAADVLAVLEETVDDLKKGREDGKMNRSLEKRFRVFEYRVGRIKEMFTYEKADELLNYIAQMISVATTLAV